ncbi:hypothetical protein ACWGID_21945 [Kribbella sp. NPDC054772]
MARGELSGRPVDRNPNQPDSGYAEPPPSPPVPEASEPTAPSERPEPDSPAVRPAPKPLDNASGRGQAAAADRRTDEQDLFASYPPEIRDRLLKDDTLARLQYRARPNDSTPVTPTDKRADQPTTDAEPPSTPERADQPTTDDPQTEPRDDQLSPRRREKMAANPLFARDGWGQNLDDGDSPEPEEHPQPDADTAADRSVDDDDGDSQAQVESTEAREPAPQEDAEGKDTPENEFVETPDDPRDMDTYRRIREADDVDAVAENSAFPREVVEEAKEHLFVRQHDVAVGPGEVRHGHFMPLSEVGVLWERVASGAELTDRQRVEFWSLLAHEYVEAKLMDAGLPYLSADPAAWDEYGPRVTREHLTAHAAAPRSMQSTMKDLLVHRDSTLVVPRDQLRVAEDLSNLDEVVRVAKEGLGL